MHNLLIIHYLLKVTFKQLLKNVIECLFDVSLNETLNA